MSIIKNVKEADDCFLKGTLFSPIFKESIEVWIEKDVSMEYAEKCAEHFTNLSDSFVDDFCNRAVEYYEFMREEWEEYEIFEDISDEIEQTMPEDIEGREILKYISSPQMFIFVPQGDMVGYNVECECVWEPEHGLDWIIRGNKTLYVGQAEGLGAWADDEEYESVF